MYRRTGGLALAVAGLMLSTGCGAESPKGHTPVTGSAKAATTHEIQGTVVESDITGAVGPLVGEYPGVSISDMSLSELRKGQEILGALQGGKSYPCPEGSGGGYEDIKAGAQVVVEDGESKVLATSELTGGTLTADGCSFDFAAEVPEVPFYRVTVTHRGALTYSLADLKKQNWHVDSALG